MEKTGDGMKLPEYNNRPAGTPLYSDPSSNDELDDLKYTVLGFGLTGGTLLCFGAAAVLLLLAIFN
jgi:hypothetical protein